MAITKRSVVKFKKPNLGKRPNQSHRIIQDFIDYLSKYQTIIGIILFAIVLVIGLLILRPQNKQSNDLTGDLSERIVGLEKQISQLTDRVNELSNQNNSIAQSIDNLPKVAGASSARNTSVSSTSQKLQSATTQNSSKINLNSASESQLDSLSGIGPTYAKRIVDYRNSNGGYKSIDEIKNVKGIGDKTFEKFKDQITI